MTNACPICDYRGRFKNFRGRIAAQCPGCGSLERHRVIWLFWREVTDLFVGVFPPDMTARSPLAYQRKRMLHMAPEACFRSRLVNLEGLDYITGDLNPTAAKAMRKLDLCRLDIPTASCDIFHVSHVLEHVPDDAAAMAELYRVLKHGGWGTIQVPIRHGQHTFIDPLAKTPNQRKVAYGQHNHVRIYGELDLPPALRAAGFTVEVVPYADRLPPDQLSLYSVPRDELVFFCYKPPLPFNVV
jgi:SAM-dependent methyltransferase